MHGTPLQDRYSCQETERSLASLDALFEAVCADVATDMLKLRRGHFERLLSSNRCAYINDRLLLREQITRTRSFQFKLSFDSRKYNISSGWRASHPARAVARELPLCDWAALGTLVCYCVTPSETLRLLYCYCGRMCLCRVRAADETIVKMSVIYDVFSCYRLVTAVPKVVFHFWLALS